MAIHIMVAGRKRAVVGIVVQRTLVELVMQRRVVLGILPLALDQKLVARVGIKDHHDCNPTK